MLHFFWYKADGTLGAEAICGGGWPAGSDPNNPSDPSPDVRQFSGYIASTQPDFSSWVSYDCPCNPEDVWCQCAFTKLRTSIVSSGVLITKPDTIMVINDVDTAHTSNDTPTPMTAGASFTLKLREETPSSIPDGTEISLLRASSVLLSPSLPLTLTFTGGESNTVNLTPPALGLVGGVGFYHWEYSHGGSFFVLGQ